MRSGQAVEEVRPLHQGVAMETQADSVLARLNWNLEDQRFGSRDQAALKIESIPLINRFPHKARALPAAAEATPEGRPHLQMRKLRFTEAQRPTRDSWQIGEIRIFDLAHRLPLPWSQGLCGSYGNSPVTS